MEIMKLGIVESCIPDVIKNMNVKVFNVVSWSNQIKHIEWHEACKCKCRLNSVCHKVFKVFVTINKDGMKISVDVTVENN